MNFISEIFGYPLGYIMQGCYYLTHNYALSLLLFTLVTKVLLFPLAVKQQKSTAQMAVFQPKITEIQKKFANDKKKQQDEMMKLYSDYGYNPAGGCLPMLIQFPILFGLIDVIYKPLTHIIRIPSDVITKGIEIAKELPGITVNSINPQVSLISAVQTSPDAFGKIFSAGQMTKIQEINFSFFGLDLSQMPQLAFNAALLIPILAGLSMILSSVCSMKFSGSGQAMAAGAGGNTSKFMLYGMSIFSAVFAFQVPMGVGLYWIFQNVILIGQSYLLNRIYNPKKLAVAYEEKMKAVQESKKKKVKIEVEDKKTGSKKVVEKTLSEKEINLLRLAKARELDAKKYGDINEDPQEK